MNKLFARIASITAGLALVVGAGVALASHAEAKSVSAETQTLTFSFSSKPDGWPSTNSAGNYNYTLDDTTYTFSLGNNVYCNSGYLMLKYTTSLGLPSIAGAKLTKIVASNSSGCSTSTKVGVSSSSSSASYISGGSIQTWSTISSSYTYNLSGTTAGTMYYLYITNKNCQIVSLELTYDIEETGTPAISLSNSSLSFLTNDSAKTITVTPNDQFTGTPTISVSGTPSYVNVSVNGLVLSVSPKAIGTEEITVNAVHNSEQASATFNVTVIDSHGHCVDDPYTVAEARAATDAGTGVTGVYVQGIISEIVEGWSTQYKNISFNISSDGETTSDQLEAFRCKSSAEHPISSDNDIEVGATVVVYGDLVLFNTTYELNSGCTIKSYTAPTPVVKVLDHITVDASGAKTVFAVGEAFSSEGIVVTAYYNNSTNAVVTPTSVSSPDMTSAGEKTVTVSYTEGGETKSETYTITVTSITYTIKFDANGGGGSMSDREVAEGANFEIPACEFTAPEGKVFDHWEVNGEEKTIIENVDDSHTVVAIWKDASATSTLSATFGNDKSTSSTEITDGDKYKTDYSYTIDSDLSFSDISKVYPQTSNALKFGSSGAVGSMTVKVNVENAVIVSVTVNAYRYHDTKDTTMTIGGIEQELTTSAADYVADVSSAQSDSVVISALSTSSDKRFFVVSLTIEYSTSGVTPVEKELVSIAVSGDYKTSFEVGDEFEFGGVVTATYSSGSPKNVTASADFNGFDSSAVAESQTITVSYTEGEVTKETSYNVSISEPVPPVVLSARYYSLVTSTDELYEGGKYIITNEASDGAIKVLSSTQNSNNRGAADCVVTNDLVIVNSNDVQVITLGKDSENYTLGVDGGYLYAASNSSNHLKTQETLDNNGKWTISFGEGGIATITAQGTNSHNVLQYNSSSKLFSCYVSGQKDVYIYRLNFAESLKGNITCDGAGSHSFADGFDWNSLKTIYSDLSTAEKALLKTSDADGMDRYDYLVAKYKYENFIERDEITLRYIPAMETTVDSNVAIMVVTIVAITSISAIGVILVIKRRKAIR